MVFIMSNFFVLLALILQSTKDTPMIRQSNEILITYNNYMIFKSTNMSKKMNGII